MHSGYVICDRTSGIPSYFSLEVARDFASNSGWSPTADKALGFARKADAEIFMNKYLPHVAPIGTVEYHEWEKA